MYNRHYNPTGLSITPYHDMHNRYGEVLTWKPLSSSDRHARLWNDYAEDHKGVDQFYHELLVEYLDKFSRYFGGVCPVSFHSHASDAIIPHTIASLLIHLAKFSSRLFDGNQIHGDPFTSVTRILQWQETHHRSPQLAVLSGSFGAGYGSMAAICPFIESREVACGNQPIVINAEQEKIAIRSDLMDAKSQGAIALVVQINIVPG
ncbi:hypothetical protein GGS24DRAFT_484282 [Hypoxylon argillaceum]|nr:hypothetical protein GGS24DRAFT_484282 [Hypoxylon argillaceum]